MVLSTQELLTKVPYAPHIPWHLSGTCSANAHKIAFFLCLFITRTHSRLINPGARAAYVSQHARLGFIDCGFVSSAPVRHRLLMCVHVPVSVCVLPRAFSMAHTHLQAARKLVSLTRPPAALQRNPLRTTADIIGSDRYDGCRSVIALPCCAVLLIHLFCTIATC